MPVALLVWAALGFFARQPVADRGGAFGAARRTVRSGRIHRVARPRTAW
jgi:hypothetical protein